jgi:hydrogenase maturation protease
MRGWDLPPAVRCLDGGTLGLSLLPHLEGVDSLLLVDAVAADAPPGTLVRLEGDEVPPAVFARLSTHQVGVSDLLDGARWLGHYPTRVILLGVVPASMELGVERTPAVAAAVPALVDAVVAELAALGHPPVARESSRESPDRSGDVALAVGL